MQLPKYSMGIGDRFGMEGDAQLAAMKQAEDAGVLVAPVWNKSFREHQIVHTRPDDVRVEADAAVKSGGWEKPYFVDADHIGFSNVDGFISSSDFFTLDVADDIGKSASADEIAAFVELNRTYIGSLLVPGIDAPFTVTEDEVIMIAEKYLSAVKEAGRIYRHICEQKGSDNFVTEVSMDETDLPQTPLEMFFILSAVAAEKIPAQTIAPKFSGRFNKGVDYVGNVKQFAQEFEQDVAVTRFAVLEFGLPENLKMSVHSGSDKFSIYPAINKAINTFDAGLHLKTAGTTWLEELIGLVEGNKEGLAIAKEIYCEALGRYDELCGPYATVIDIDPAALPDADIITSWDGATFSAALKHDLSCPAYNLNLRQLLHVSYKVAAQMGDRYKAALAANRQSIEKNVTGNLFDRHIKAVFLG